MDDLGIISQDALIPPQILQEEYPLTFEAKLTVFNARKQAAKILKKEDDRLIVIG
jgi:3-deoxy-7-phosphoheptulonate synthase